MKIIVEVNRPLKQADVDSIKNGVAGILRKRITAMCQADNAWLIYKEGFRPVLDED